MNKLQTREQRLRDSLGLNIPYTAEEIETLESWKGATETGKTTVDTVIKVVDETYLMALNHALDVAIVAQNQGLDIIIELAKLVEENK